MNPVQARAALNVIARTRRVLETQGGPDAERSLRILAALPTTSDEMRTLDYEATLNAVDAALRLGSVEHADARATADAQKARGGLGEDARIVEARGSIAPAAPQDRISGDELHAALPGLLELPSAQRLMALIKDGKLPEHLLVKDVENGTLLRQVHGGVKLAPLLYLTDRGWRRVATDHVGDVLDLRTFHVWEKHADYEIGGSDWDAMAEDGITPAFIREKLDQLVAEVDATLPASGQS